MADIRSLAELQTAMFCLMMAGWFMTKKGILPPAVRKPMTDLIIDFVLPSNIIVSFLIEFNRQILISCMTIFLVSVGIQMFAAVAGRLFYPGIDKEKLPVVRYGTIVSNAGFLGNPIVEGLYGSQGLLYASIYLIPQRIVMWSAGISCFTGSKGKQVIKKVLTHPCIVAVFVGVLLLIFQVHLPGGIEKTLRYSSNCTTALSMIVIGNILAEVQASEILERDCLWFCLIRLIVFPAVVLLGCRLLGLDELVTEVSVVLAGMPAATTTAILAAKYDRDAHFAVKIVFLSTVLSLITVPLLCMVMTKI